MTSKSGTEKQQAIFSAVIFTVIAILALMVFWPFLNVLALSIIMAVLLSPLYNRIRRTIKVESLSAAITILFLLIVIIVPIAFIINNIITEAQSLYSSVSNTSNLSSDQLTAWIEGKVQVYIPDFTVDARGYLAAFSSWVVSKLGGIFSGTLDFAFKLALSFVALFYFLKDGDKLRKNLIALSPWSEERDEIILGSIKNAIRSVVAGSLTVALVQGFLVGLSFLISGVPNPTLWGTLAAVSALVPGVGTAIVMIPAIIYLFVIDPSSWQWIFQLAWAIGIVGLVDNFLGPVIMQKGIHIHPLLILFSVLGGIQFFGPEGFLLGPLVLSLLFVLVRTLKGDVHLVAAPAGGGDSDEAAKNSVSEK